MPPLAPAAPRRAFQWDLARQQERLDVLLNLLPRYADWGYQELYLHLEDSVEYPSLPGIARKHAYTHRQLRRLVDAATRAGIGVVPIVNLLGHTQYLIKDPSLRDLNELRDASGDPLVQGQICPLHPRTAEVASKLISDMAPFCTAGILHAGLDESFHLGKCPRCRAEVEIHGLAYHFSEHVRRLHSQVGERGLRLGMWADMLTFVPEAIQRLPSGLVAYDWYYYPFRRHPRVELYNFAESDLATPLQRQGIEYWGCPMNGAFRYEPLPIFGDRLANIRSWWARCRKVNAAGMLICSWEAYRLAFELTTVVDAAAASLWLDEGQPTDKEMLERGFRRVFGTRAGAARRSASAALAADKYPFSGYARWELNDRWDARAAPVEDSRATEASREKRHFTRLAHRTEGMPAPLGASLRFRAYLADREQFVVSAAAAIFALRQALAAGKTSQFLRQLSALENSARSFSTELKRGQAAARAMWQRTRRTIWPSPNREVLRADGGRLHTLRAWLKGVRREPGNVWTQSPVCGAWQLVFHVQNFAPALQRVSVEQEGADGSWAETYGRYTIEFRAEAAHPRVDVHRLFSVPVARPPEVERQIRPLPSLHLVLKGLGPVRIHSVVLTDGHHRWVPARGGPGKRLGVPTPRSGLPRIGEVQEIWRLEF